MKTIRLLMKMEDWDLMVAVIRSTDSLQHTFWKDVEAVMAGTEGSPSSYSRSRAEAVFTCYEKIDYELGEIWSKWGENYNLMLMSDHGFGVLHREVCLNRVLAEAGLLKFKRRKSFRHFKEHLFHSAKARLPAGARRRIIKLLGGDVKTGLLFVDSLVADVDWEKTYLYSLGQFGCLFVNTRGREPIGIVKTKKEEQAVLAEAEAALGELTDPSDGQKVVTNIYRGENIYHGQRITEMPGLIAVMRNHAYRGVYCTSAELERDDIICSPTPEWGNLAPTGCHRREGMLIMYGPGVRKGVDLGVAQITDVAPTVLSLLGLPPLPQHDGVPLEAALNTGNQRLQDIAPTFEDVGSERSISCTYSEEEEAAVRERLRNLGYI
jgi:predicted AlkP superfamily phosphohydrolase/phosphomutase